MNRSIRITKKELKMNRRQWLANNAHNLVQSFVVLIEE